MTPKQQAFADEYIISLNATDAARKAGYSNRTATETGYENLRKPHIKAYIDKRLEELKSERVADQQEVMEYLTRLMRGEERETEMINVGNFEQELVQVPVKHNIRKQAAELIGKRYSLWTEKIDVTNKNIEIVVGEWDEEESSED